MSDWVATAMTCSLSQPEYTSTSVGDPIDVITGANWDITLDFELSGPLPLAWARDYYSSQNSLSLPLGRGHTHWYDQEMRRGVHCPFIDTMLPASYCGLSDNPEIPSRSFAIKSVR